MIEAIKGKYQQGKIELDNPLNLQDGTEVLVTVTPTPTVPADDADTGLPAGSWVGNVPDDFEEQVYADRRRKATRPPARW